ncbi:Uncharacterised protein g11352 [Pycnogonum litorale]
MSTVDEELSSKVSVLSLSDINRLTVDDDIKSDKILLSASSNKYDSPFRGLLASQLKCKKCSYKVITLILFQTENFKDIWNRILVK